MSYEQVQQKKVLDSKTVSAGTSEYSEVVVPLLVNGYFSLQLQIEGSGTCKIEYELANGVKAPFVMPDAGVDWQTGLTSSSGNASDGNLFFPLSPAISIRFRFKVTETGGASSVTVTGWLAVL